MKNYKGNMVLIELIIAVFFFALSQAVILQVFAASQKANTNSIQLSRALFCAQDAAESLSSSDDPEQVLLDLGFQKADGAYQLTEEGFSVRATILREELASGSLVTVTLTGLQQDTELFSFPAASYQGVSAQ